MDHRERWLTEDGRRTAAKVLRRLSWRRSLDGLGLPTVDGRIDLRGFTLAEPGFTPVQAAGLTVGVADRPLPELRKARLRGVDLSGARLRHFTLIDPQFEDCLLRGADLTNFGAWRGSFERCDLSGATITGTVLSARHRGTGTTWRDCTFDDLTMTGALVDGATFERCTFDRTRIAEMFFKRCAFTACRMSGELEDVTFVGPAALTDLDLRGCRLVDVSFTGMRLSGVRLPIRDSLTVVPDATGILSRLQAAGHPELEFWVGYQLQHHTPGDDLYLDYDSLQAIVGDTGIALIRDAVARATS
ncbi:pentapeptide repeat-containing protein [Actinoplanes palleronii]|uniref:Pentapeptide repeat protein n=1 Tax=Actinoplanes palleronii TaxID=113570 RepID=A0ABQ4BJS4_9ACTN|nr:pentapeptide repeat-containing protein [Actinoplanes palleronii]GIE70495.1 hypothetical protein Apa02nite_066030 [Actinoplanes palleronii]